VLSPDEEESRRAWFEDHWRKHIPFTSLLGLEIIDWDPDVVRARLPFEPRLSAHDGVFHGGVLATVIDSVGTGAVVAGHDFNLGSRFTTVSMTVQYMAVAPNQDVLVEGRCAKRGRRLNFARGTVLTEAGTILAEGMLTVSASGERPRLGAPEAGRGEPG
jgi:uncharacterized protein (TIGR00369 family)